MIVSVDKWKAKSVYLARAEQYGRAMNFCLNSRDWDACGGNAIHCVISAADAFCIHFKAQRYKGADHREAIEFFRSLIRSEEHKRASQRLAELLRIKTDAEYGDRNLSEKEAGQAKLSAERFLAYVKASVI